MANSNQRSRQVFDAVDLTPATKAASGRYIRSEPFRPGVRYWASHANGLDLFGVQFFGSGLASATTLQRALVAAGFLERTRQPTQLTFCRQVRGLSDDGIDAASLKAAKSDLDAVLNPTL